MALECCAVCLTDYPREEIYQHDPPTICRLCATTCGWCELRFDTPGDAHVVEPGYGAMCRPCWLEWTIGRLETEKDQGVRKALTGELLRAVKELLADERSAA